MCAICGIINNTGRVNEAVLTKMTDIMDYRGPDERGILVRDGAGLGHRRLKIIDLHTGRQPMSNEDNTLFLVCNGEVYNFADLRQALEKKGHRFKSKSDNEVILHLYEDKGIEALKDIRGMFAFALWDERKKELFLARDRIGKKPLVYSLIPGGIVFASELKSVILHPKISKEIDPHAVDLFLTYQAIPSPRTIFKKIKKLQPASYLLWKNGEIKIQRYWDIDFTKKISLGNEEEYSELLWEKLKEATKLRMISDVPLGAFLSGGIDSSTIVGIMSGMSSQKVRTFSVGFDIGSFSELKYARIAAEKFCTEHHEFTVKPDVMEILPKLVWHYNEPFGDPSMVPSYYVARETKKYVTVALNGDGGDESLAGYTRYWQVLLLEKITGMYLKGPSKLRRDILSLLLRGYDQKPSSIFFRIWKWMEEAEKHGYDYAYARRLISFSEKHRQDIYSGYMKENTEKSGYMSFVKESWEKAGDVKLLEKMLYSDLHLYLPEVLTVKMDIAAMANALEARSPFLDQEFVETAASFPANLKFKKFTSKYILKKKLKGFLPEKILKRRKMGFGMPVGNWFRGELKEYLCSYLLSEKFRKRAFFNAENTEKMVKEHIEGKGTHTQRLWNLLVFEIWCRTFMDGEN